jgi:hypothetical protein
MICDGIPQPSRSAEIIRVVIIMTAIGLPMALLRAYSRHLVSKFWWDDWIVVVAAASFSSKSSLNLELTFLNR